MVSPSARGRRWPTGASPAPSGIFSFSSGEKVTDGGSLGPVRKCCSFSPGEKVADGGALSPVRKCCSFSPGEKVADGGGRMRGHFCPSRHAFPNTFTPSPKSADKRSEGVPGALRGGSGNVGVGLTLPRQESAPRNPALALEPARRPRWRAE